MKRNDVLRPRKTGRPRLNEVVERRQRILDCATAVFIEDGYEAANLDEIADAAGVGKVTIYRHFKNKAELFRSVVTEATRGMATSLKETLDRRLPVETALLAFAARQNEIMTRRIAGGYPMFEMLRLIISVALKMPDLAKSYLQNFYDDMAEPLSLYLKEKCDEGVLAIAECNLVAGYFVQTNFFTEAILVNPAVLPSAKRRQEIARQTVKLFLDGCRVKR